MVRKLVFKISQLLRKFGIDLSDKEHPAILEMKEKIEQLKGIKFDIEIYPDGSWTAESKNIDGIITGGKDIKESNFVIKDAVFTYFNIPSHLCNDDLLKSPNEPVVVKQQVWAVS